MNLQSAENLVISPNGSWVAVSINHRKSIIIYEFDKQKKRINTSNYYVFKSPENNCHGINFSKDSRYLFFTTLRPYGGIHVCKFHDQNKTCSLEYVRKIPNQFFPFKPKSLDFSYDGNYIVVIYANNVIKEKTAYEGKIAIYEFNKNTGTVDKAPISVFDSVEVFKSGEDIRFYKNTYSLIVSEQSADRISVYDFDPIRKKIAKAPQEVVESSHIS